MKNKIFIQTLNKVKPSKEEKDKMLKSILSKKRKARTYGNYIWKFGMVSLCLTCSFLIINGFYKEDMGIYPASIVPRALMEELNEFCYQDICYKRVRMEKSKSGGVYLDTIDDNNEEIEIYQGEQKDTIILKYDNSYFLYQKIER